MLRRTIKHPHPAGRLIGIMVDSVTGTPVGAIGPDEVSSFTDNGAGDTTLNHKFPGRRASLCVVTNNLVGGYGCLNAAATAAATRVLSKDSTGANADSGIDALTLHYHCASTAKADLHKLMCSRAAATLIGLQIDGSTGTPVAAIGSPAVSSITDNGVGDYTINLKRAFAHNSPIVLATGFDPANIRQPYIISRNYGAIRIGIQSAVPAAADDIMNVMILGFDAGHSQHQLFRAAKCNMAQNRFLAGRITVAVGVPSAAIGDDYTVAALGAAGNYRITYTKAFRREPIVVASCIGNFRVQIGASSATVCDVQCFDAAGAAADPTGLDFFVLGSDLATEF